MIPPPLFPSVLGAAFPLPWWLPASSPDSTAWTQYYWRTPPQAGPGEVLVPVNVFTYIKDNGNSFVSSISRGVIFHTSKFNLPDLTFCKFVWEFFYLDISKIIINNVQNGEMKNVFEVKVGKAIQCLQKMQRSDPGNFHQTKTPPQHHCRPESWWRLHLTTERHRNPRAISGWSEQTGTAGQYPKLQAST